MHRTSLFDKYKHYTTQPYPTGPSFLPPDDVMSSSRLYDPSVPSFFTPDLRDDMVSSSPPYNPTSAADALAQDFAESNSSSESIDLLSINTASDTAEEADRWTLRSIETTNIVPGLGMLSGRAILAFGQLQIRMLKKVWIAFRRRAISAQFSRGTSTTSKDLGEMYDDLIDFTRYICLLNVIRHGATLTTAFQGRHVRSRTIVLGDKTAM